MDKGKEEEEDGSLRTLVFMFQNNSPSYIEERDREERERSLQGPIGERYDGL